MSQTKFTATHIEPNACRICTLCIHQQLYTPPTGHVHEIGGALYICDHWTHVQNCGLHSYIYCALWKMPLAHMGANHKSLPMKFTSYISHFKHCISSAVLSNSCVAYNVTVHESSSISNVNWGYNVTKTSCKPNIVLRPFSKNLAL